MQELENEIIEWYRATFPNATFDAKRKKMVEECRELISALFFGSTQDILEEAADIFIVAVSLAADKKVFEDNVTMRRVIADKLAVNKARVWGEETDDGDRQRVR